MAQFFLQAFQWHGERRQFGERALYTDSIEQLRDAAGARQVRVRGRDCAGGIHHAKQRRLDHVPQIPELTTCDTGDHRQWPRPIRAAQVAT